MASAEIDESLPPGYPSVRCVDDVFLVVRVDTCAGEPVSYHRHSAICRSLRVFAVEFLTSKRLTAAEDLETATTQGATFNLGDQTEFSCSWLSSLFASDTALL